MSRKTMGLDDAVIDYVRAYGLREGEIARALREETGRMPQANMQISAEQGQFLALLLEIMGARRVIEVGTFTGYSALWMAEAIGPEGLLVACDVSDEWTAVARRYWGMADVQDRISLRLGDARDTLQALLQESRGTWDLVFVDADKSGYAAYAELAHALLREGGVLAVDNTLWSGKVLELEGADADTAAIHAFNQALVGDERWTVSLLPIGDGLTLARKR